MKTWSTTEPPFVSIIIPVYNDASGIARIIGSLEDLSYPKSRFEVIVCDNNSDVPIALPNTTIKARVVKCLKPGSYAARNKAVHVATGEILAFTDADCVPEPCWLEHGVKRVITENGRSIVGGEVVFMLPPIPTGTALYQAEIGFCQKENITERGFSATANLFCTREIINSIGPFDERLLSCGDREWAWRALARGFNLVFEPQAKVATLPRSSLRAAIRQTRRVAAGRMQLRKLKLEHIGQFQNKRPRSIIQSISWITHLEHRSYWERLLILGAATLTGIAGRLEVLRLRFGYGPERR